MTASTGLIPREIIRRAEGRIARFDAELMLSHLLGTDKVGLYIYEKGCPEEIAEKFDVMTAQRARGKPLQYIVGEAGFMGLEFGVNPDVLIPRPETELLVEEVIRAVRTIIPPPTPKNPVKILDLGTGSGNIAISLTKHITNCKIIASDISKKALLTADRNASVNGAADKIDFVLSDLFEDVPSVKFDIIVSNPPYVRAGEMERLQKEIGFEPRAALEAGGDGLEFYRRISAGAKDFLRVSGVLAFELGIGQSEMVRMLLEKHGYNNIKVLKDYNYINRVITARWTR